MQNPFQANTDAQSAMNDPLGFIKKLWGDMQLPGMVTPTISVDELDKQIKDLKTVESWLTVNMNMLRGTIQALEVQRATIAALKTMGESFAQSTTSTAKAGAKSAEPNHTQWPMHQHADTISEAQADAENDLEEDEVEDAPEPSSTTTQTTETTQQAPNTGDGAESAYSNPAAWWNVLQNQFKQALGNALKDEEADGEKLAQADIQKKKVAKRSTVQKTAASSTKAAKTAKPTKASKSIAPKSTRATKKVASSTPTKPTKATKATMPKATGVSKRK